MIRTHPDDPPLTAGEDVHQADLLRKLDRVLDGARTRAEKK